MIIYALIRGRSRITRQTEINAVLINEYFLFKMILESLCHFYFKLMTGFSLSWTLSNFASFKS